MHSRTSLSKTKECLTIALVKHQNKIKRNICLFVFDFALGIGTSLVSVSSFVLKASKKCEMSMRMNELLRMQKKQIGSGIHVM